MPERTPLTEQKEIEFWNGHHFKDKCVLTDNVRHLVLHESYSQYESAFKRVKDLRKSGQAHPVRKLTGQERFCPSDFAVGTILRIEYDESYFGVDRRGEIVWGVVDQVREFPSGKEEFDIVLGYVEEKLQADKAPITGRRNFYVDSGSPAVIGEVNHFRESGQFAFGLVKVRYPLPVLDILTGMSQHLIRYSSVEVWAYGQAIRKPAVDAESLKRRQFVQNPLGV